MYNLKITTGEKAEQFENACYENIEDLKKALSKKSNELITAQKLLSEKDSEINDLKATQDHISVQYNELAEYAGKLQDELRKIRYM